MLIDFIFWYTFIYYLFLNIYSEYKGIVGSI